MLGNRGILSTLARGKHSATKSLQTQPGGPHWYCSLLSFTSRQSHTATISNCNLARSISRLLGLGWYYHLCFLLCDWWLFHPHTHHIQIAGFNFMDLYLVSKCGVEEWRLSASCSLCSYAYGECLSPSARHLSLPGHWVRSVCLLSIWLTLWSMASCFTRNCVMYSYT